MNNSIQLTKDAYTFEINKKLANTILSAMRDAGLRLHCEKRSIQIRVCDPEDKRTDIEVETFHKNIVKILLPHHEHASSLLHNKLPAQHFTVVFEVALKQLKEFE